MPLTSKERETANRIFWENMHRNTDAALDAALDALAEPKPRVWKAGDRVRVEEPEPHKYVCELSEWCSSSCGHDKPHPWRESDDVPDVCPSRCYGARCILELEQISRRYLPRCNAAHPQNRFLKREYCQREKGHTGEHCCPDRKGECMVTWPQEPEQCAAREPELYICENAGRCTDTEPCACQRPHEHNVNFDGFRCPRRGGIPGSRCIPVSEYEARKKAKPRRMSANPLSQNPHNKEHDEDNDCPKGYPCIPVSPSRCDWPQVGDEVDIDSFGFTILALDDIRQVVTLSTGDRYRYSQLHYIKRATPQPGDAVEHREHPEWGAGTWYTSEAWGKTGARFSNSQPQGEWETDPRNVRIVWRARK